MVALIENMNNENYNGVLKPADLELIERVIYKNGDDVAVSIARSFERIEEMINDAEARVYSRVTDFENELGVELKTLHKLAEGSSKVAIGGK